MTTNTPTCSYDTDHGWLTPGDNPRPCAEDHCGLQRTPCGHHVKHTAGTYTCPTCIGRTRTDLTTIKTLYNIDLVIEALNAGVNSEAANLIGPGSIGWAGRTETEFEQRESVDWRRGLCSWPRDHEAPALHPYVVLGDLDLSLRDTYGPVTELEITVPRAADYLTGLLNGTFPHEDQFEDAALRIRRLRSHMEAVAHTARRAERGHHCPTCTHELAGTNTTPVRLLKNYARGSGLDVIAGKLDTWHCATNPAHWWTDSDYRATIDALTREHVREGHWITANEAAERFNIKTSRLRKWASRNQVKSRWIAEQLRYNAEQIDKLLANEPAVG